MKIVFLLVLLLLCSCGDSPEPEIPAPEPDEPSGLSAALPPDVELEELRLVVRTLAEENRGLRRALEEVRDNGTVTPRAPIQPPAASEPDVPVSPFSSSETATVLYVNPNWHYLVINQGTEDGIQAGRTIGILRENTPIATATVTDCKPGQAVAEVNLDSLGTSGLYPRANDRVQIR